MKEVSQGFSWLPTTFGRVHHDIVPFYGTSADYHWSYNVPQAHFRAGIEHVPVPPTTTRPNNVGNMENSQVRILILVLGFRGKAFILTMRHFDNY